MDDRILPILWICFCISFLTLCVLAARSKDSRYVRILPTKELTWAFTAGVSIFVVCQPFLMFPDLLAGSSETLSQVLNLSMAVIGLVITTSTGIAVATSWRALDNAKNADEHAAEALSEYQSIKNELDSKVLSQSAYLEALDAKFQYMGDPDSIEFRVAEGYCDALIAPNEATRINTIIAINSVDEYVSVAERIFQFRFQENFLHTYFSKIADDQSLEKNVRNSFIQWVD